MVKIMISPYSRKIRGNQNCAKDYPYWMELLSMLKKHDIHITQLGTIEEKPLVPLIDDHFINQPFDLIKQKLDEMDAWISVDNFFQHFCAFHKKPGFVIWGPSDPKLFGHDMHVNIQRQFPKLRAEQFAYWHDEQPNKTFFPFPDRVCNKVIEKLKENGKL